MVVCASQKAIYVVLHELLHQYNLLELLANLEEAI